MSENQRTPRDSIDQRRLLERELGGEITSEEMTVANNNSDSKK